MSATVAQRKAAGRAAGGDGKRRRGRRFNFFTFLVLAGALLGLYGTDLRAQSPAPFRKLMNDNVIVLPVRIDARFADEVREVRLFVKDSANAEWKFAGSLPATQKEFVYKAAGDGEFWFTLITVNKAGQPSGDVAAQPAMANVVVDRQPPEVQVHSVGMMPTGHCVQCKIADANLDPAATVFEYQTQDGVWRALDTVAGSFDTYCIPAQARTTGQVRVTAADRCGNKATKSFTLQDTPSEKVEPKAVATKPAANPNPPAPVVHEANTASALPPASMPPAGLCPVPALPLKETVAHAPTALTAGNGSSGSAIKQTSYSPAPAQAAPPKQLVNQTKFRLNYQIEEVGQSGVGKVEVYITGDLGQNWQRLAEDRNHKSPVELTLPGEGMFGLRLVATNGFGFGGEAPAPGSQPDYWVEVDTTPPQVQLMSAEPLKGAQAGTVHITWVASDKNLLDEPIDLWFSPEPSGPWLPIAKCQKNTGQFRWQVPQLNCAKLYVRVTATDRAGNVGSSQSAQPVQPDDQSRPRVHIQGIITTPTTPAGAPSLVPVPNP